MTLVTEEHLWCHCLLSRLDRLVGVTVVETKEIHQHFNW